MSARPGYLDWGGVKIEPTPGEKAAGFAPGDRPPAQWWNWQLGTIDDWFRYLSTSAIEINALLSPAREFVLGTDLMRAFARNSDALCMVGDNGACYSSFDEGVTWTKDINGYSTGQTFTDITRGNAGFIAVGYNGHLQTCYTNGGADEQFWNAPGASTFGTDAILSIAYDAAGTFCIVGGLGKSAHSLDNGDTWIANPVLPVDLLSVIGDPTGPGFFASAWYDGASVGLTDTIWHSPDGITFTAIDLSAVLDPLNEFPTTVTHSALSGGWVVGVDNSNGFAGVILSKDNGVTWTRLSVESPSTTGIGFVRRGSLIAPAGLLYLADGFVGYSASGASWGYAISNTFSPTMYDAYGSQRYIARDLGAGKHSLTTWAY